MKYLRMLFLHKFENMKRIVSYNLNGIRAAMQKGLTQWLADFGPDILCIQELKASPDQIELHEFERLGYHSYFFPAVKKGYSGVAIFSRPKPDHVEYGMNMKQYDDEGRLLRADFGPVSVLSAYFPSGTTGEERQSFKMQWLNDFTHYINTLKKERPQLIISGDYNICNKPIDIHNPERNKNSSGFLPEEREWFDQFLATGFIDSFRHFDPSPHNYSWWSFRAGSRQKNLGWRIDYHLVSTNLKDSLRGASILPHVVHSDHCPVVLDIYF